MNAYRCELIKIKMKKNQKYQLKVQFYNKFFNLYFFVKNGELYINNINYKEFQNIVLEKEQKRIIKRYIQNKGK